MKKLSRFPSNLALGKNQLENENENEKFFRTGRNCLLLRQRQVSHYQFNNLLALGRGMQFCFPFKKGKKNK